jgi:3-oxoacyl-[acyl-carrier-protein] synthase II
MSDRVVVTGGGVIAPIGAGEAAFAAALYAGASGVAASARLGGARAAEIADLNPQPWLGNKGIRVLDRAARLLCISAQMALAETGSLQDPAGSGDPGLGLVCGTMFGGVHSIASFDYTGLTEGPSNVNPMEFPNTVINSPTGQAAIKFKLRGINSTISAGLASGLYAIQYAAEFLRFGRASMLLAGGVEEVCEEHVLAFSKLGAATGDGLARPFSAAASGAVPGEGAALWALETATGALARGATPQLEICGFGAAHDAEGLQTFRVRAEGATHAVEQALASSGIGAADICCVVASAGGQPAGDAMEAHALKNVFGARLAELPVCAPKAALGEAMGASGALAAFVAGLALRRQSLPPTAGFESSASGLRLSAAPQPVNGEYALVNAFGCDGNNAALVVRLWKN